jgi:hypothetical protein
MTKKDLIKKPNQLVEYTTESIQELRLCSRDPIYFAGKYVKVMHPTKGAIAMDLYDYQVRAIKAFQSNRWCIMKAGRQLGKTAVISIYLLWFASFNSHKNILVASKDNAGAMDIMNRIRFSYEELPNWLKPGVKAYNRHSIEFDNGSMITSTSTTETTGRGKSISLLMLDELAHVRQNIQQAMWTSLAPTLSTGGSCIVSSTPNGDSDLFAQLWRQAVSGVITDEDGKVLTDSFKAIEVEWNEHPDRTEEYRTMMINKITEELWKQEYECLFLSSDPLLINTMILQNLKGKNPLYTDKGFIFWKEPDPHKRYVIGVDVAEGMKKDFSVIQVIEVDTLEQVAEYRNNTIKENQLFEAIKYVINKIHSYVDKNTGKRPEIFWSFENNSAGAAIGALYYNDEKFPEYGILINEKGSKLGFRTANKTKLDACRNLKNLVEKQKNGLTINSSMLIFELKNYVATGASYEAKSGSTDDLVAAMLIVLRVLKYLSAYETDVFDKLYRSDGSFYDEESEFVEEIAPMPFSFSL